jgi:hypothetical protein
MLNVLSHSIGFVVVMIGAESVFQFVTGFGLSIVPVSVLVVFQLGFIEYEIVLL